MNKTGLVIGILLTVISGTILMICLILLMVGRITNEQLLYGFYSVLGLIVGIVLISTSGSRERQEFEEYKRMRQNEEAMYYRYANAKGKPIEEYTMDDRTKVMVYYDRLPPKYQKKIVEDVDRIYRQFESELYTKK